MNRHLLLTGEWLLDWFQVELAEEPRSIEWWMHPAVQPLTGTLEERSEVYTLRIQEKDKDASAISEQKLPMIGELVPDDGKLHLSYVLGDASTVYHTALVEQGDEVLAIHTPGDSVDPSQPFTAVLHRRDDSRADFIHVYRADSRASITRVSAQEIEVSVPGQPGSAVRVQLTQDKGLIFI